jgi:hypothetical protein
VGSYGPGRRLIGLLLTGLVAVVAWFAVGRGVLDDINQSNERSGGGGPKSQRIVSAALQQCVSRYAR